MQFQSSFMLLLTGVFVVLSNTLFINALPISEKRNSGVVTLPLKRVKTSRSLHPQILLQQNINRSNRRLARMTGRDEPTTEELERHLVRRVASVEGLEGLEKRYNRGGVPKSKAKGGASNKGTSKKGKQSKGSSNHQGGEGSTKVSPDVVDDNGDPAGTSGDPKVGGQSQTGDSSDPTTPDSVTQAEPPTADNSLGLDIEGRDVGYLATVQMGTPPRDFSILMDSGSADFWVGAENCQSEDGGDCGNHQFLGPQSSSSFTDTKQPFSVTYGTGQVNGDIVTDDVNIADLALKQHKFGVALVESVEFSGDDTPFDGLMGLAKSDLSQQRVPTPIEALAGQGAVKAAVIGYKISRLSDGKNDGEITFGDVDPTKFDAASVVKLPNVNQQGFWEVKMDAVSVNGQDLNLAGRSAILDTGTTLIIAPQADADVIHAAIQGSQSDGQGGFTVPCNTQASVALTFGGTAFKINPVDIAFQPLDPNDPNGDCISGISAGNIGGAQEWLVGDVFLKNAYFSTDVDQNEVSLADLV
ncbi:hypothetical protein AGABI1DRAFT_114293 [Agaricus bisporus var. burnettii JB137-S8]|uniref:Peptidase A1 domain-containing protein n=1 Tax=Agaricus bisporus var. burnettii (strain JB137-S8 / ATCC MYA-4627 / FGSC 10392) TaxID=597362 RepID=K5WTF3_AGABU|nr:uncharacterized protein AGABI1DRAFT_114293 [Agaricus bisporus var. burnettii JB137-S8]EKM78686.1 hypothetical protein AGABI1DRAFT_114293 [Agaricus bisporus var. burnettii JB137-S8]